MRPISAASVTSAIARGGDTSELRRRGRAAHLDAPVERECLPAQGLRDVARGARRLLLESSLDQIVGRLGADRVRHGRPDLGPRQHLVDEVVELDLGRDRRRDALDHLAFDEDVGQLLRERAGEHGVDDAGQLGSGEDAFDGCFDSRA